MTSEESAARSTIDAEVTVANLHDIRRSTTAWAVCPTTPRPAVVGHESATTCSEGEVLAFTLHNGRGVMDIGSTNLRYTIRKR